jgi:hypothetical protein
VLADVAVAADVRNHGLAAPFAARRRVFGQKDGAVDRRQLELFLDLLQRLVQRKKLRVDDDQPVGRRVARDRRVRDAQARLFQHDAGGEIGARMLAEHQDVRLRVGFRPCLQKATQNGDNRTRACARTDAAPSWQASFIIASSHV